MGAIVAINHFDEYGRPQSGNSGRFQYTGQAWLAEAGLYEARLAARSCLRTASIPDSSRHPGCDQSIPETEN